VTLGRMGGIYGCSVVTFLAPQIGPSTLTPPLFIPNIFSAFCSEPVSIA
jgi:hypothetical protein